MNEPKTSNTKAEEAKQKKPVRRERKAFLKSEAGQVYQRPAESDQERQFAGQIVGKHRIKIDALSLGPPESVEHVHLILVGDKEARALAMVLSEAKETLKRIVKNRREITKLKRSTRSVLKTLREV